MTRRGSLFLALVSFTILGCDSPQRKVDLSVWGDRLPTYLEYLPLPDLCAIAIDTENRSWSEKSDRQEFVVLAKRQHLSVVECMLRRDPNTNLH